MPPKNKKGSTGSTLANDAVSDHSDSEENNPRFRDEQFIIKITQAFTASFDSCVERLIKAMDLRVNHRLDQQVSTFNLNQKVDNLEQKMKKLAEENTELKNTLANVRKRCDDLESTCDELEQYSRSKNVLVHGIATTTDEADGNNLEVRVIAELNQKLGLHVSSNDVTAVHRNRPPFIRSNLGTIASRPAPILVQFCRRSVKNDVLINRKKLKATGISISEQLTAKRVKLLSAVNELQKANKILAGWSSDGKIIVKALDNSTCPIKSFSDLSQFQ
jgi:regulator of replication initiation timing